MPKIKIFRMNDCDWMAGADLDSCKAEYIRNYSGNFDGEEDEVRELTEEEMDSLIFCDQDVTPDLRLTFRQELERLIVAGEKFPCFFASTEY